MSSRSSKSDSSASLPEFVTVGRVGKPHGIRGEVLVTPLTDVGHRFDVGEQLTLIDADGRRRRVSIVSSRCGKRALVIGFDLASTRDDAESLRGQLVEIERDRVPLPPDGSYYFFELIGCVCQDQTGTSLGKVVGIIDDGGGLLLEIEDEASRLLVPFVEVYLRHVDREARTIELELPEGLVELCASRF